MNVVVIIPSYNRYEWIRSLIEKLYTDKSNYKVKIIVFSDGSTDKRYNNLKRDFKNLIYLSENKNNGKCGYWKVISKIFQLLRKISFDYMIQIDDDFEVCDNFINVLVDEHHKMQKIDSKIVATAYTRGTKHEVQWKLQHWVDGGFICNHRLLQLIHYKIDKTPCGAGSSGVWRQLSTKITKLGYRVHQHPEILINHLGHTESKMHTEFRKKTPIVINKTI
jgi:hypothetical protein